MSSLAETFHSIPTGAVSRSSAESFVSKVFLVAALCLCLASMGAGSETYDLDNGYSDNQLDSNMPDSGIRIEANDNIIIERLELGEHSQSKSGNIEIWREDGTQLYSSYYSGAQYIYPGVSLAQGERATIFMDDQNGGSYRYNGDHESFNLLDHFDSFRGCTDYSCGNDAGGAIYHFIGITVKKFQPPQFDSTSISPEPLLFGQSVDYSASCSDPDGTCESLELTVFKDGQQVYQNSVSSSSNTWSDVYTPQSEGELNARFVATDNGGVTNTTWLNRTLTDEAPSVSLQDPSNTTYWKYDQPLSFSVSDSDSEPGEDWSCSIDKDGQQVDSAYLKEGTNSSYSGTVRSDLGQHQVSVSCSDPAGNQDTVSETYTVDDTSVEGVFGPDVTYETETPNFDMDLKNGDMINEIRYFLNWNESVVTVSDLRDTSGITTNSVFLTHPGVPLVDSNSTEYNWSMTYQVNRTTFSGNHVLENHTTDKQSQEVRWSYWENQSYFDGQARYIEREDFEHYVELRNRSAKADISGTTTYHRTGSSTAMSRSSIGSETVTWRGVLDSGNADNFNQSSFDASSSITLNFRDSSRTIDSGKDSLEVYKMKLTGCNSGLNTEETLTFDTDHETGGYDVESDLALDSTIWKTGEIERQYNFDSQGETEHTFCIYPSWASYNISTTDQLIQHQGSNGNLNIRSHFLGYSSPDTITNSTMTVPLKLHNDSATTRIGYEITDENGNAYPNVICRIDRYFPGEGESQTVAMIKTGSNGETETYLEVNEIYYIHTCYKDGERLDTFEKQTLSNPMRLQIGQDTQSDFLDYEGDLGADCSSNQTQVSCKYESSSEDLEKAVLQVNDIGEVHTSTSCKKQGSTATGELICKGLNTSENKYRASLTGYYPDDVQVQPFNEFLGDDGGWAGAIGLLATAILFLVSFLAGSFHPVAGIGLGTLSLVMSKMIGIFPVPQDILMSIVAVGVVTGWVISR